MTEFLLVWWDKDRQEPGRLIATFEDSTAAFQFIVNQIPGADLNKRIGAFPNRTRNGFRRSR